MCVLIDTHRKNKKRLFYLGQQARHTFEILFIWRFLLVENTTYGCRQTEEFEFFVRGGAAVEVARCGCH